MSAPVSVLQDAVVRAAQRMLDTGFSMNPEVVRRLSELQGLTIGVEVIDFAWQFFFTPYEDHIQISAVSEREPDTWIRSDVVNLLKARNANPGDGIDLEINGDVAAGQTFQNILSAVEFDWEELLSMYIGDMAAHHIGQFVRATDIKARRTLDSLAFSLGEYLREETALAVDGDQLGSFISAVDQLRDDVERLAVRIKRLDESKQ